MLTVTQRLLIFFAILAIAVLLPWVGGAWTGEPVRDKADAVSELLVAATLRELAADSAAAASRQALLEMLEERWTVRWSAVLRGDEVVAEFPRSTDLLRTEVLAAVDTKTRGPSVEAIRTRDPALALTALVVPQKFGETTLIAVLAPPSTSSAGWSRFGLWGIAAVLSVIGGLWFYGATVRPVMKLGRALEVGDELRALSVAGLPRDLHGLARRFGDLQRDAIGWKHEVRRLRDSVDQRVAAHTREVSDALRQTQRQADADPLTGLLNRRAFERVAAEKFAEARDDGGELAALLIDVDHFKQLNDTAGHDVGDELLIFLGKMLRSGVRAGQDLVARLGGDEFVVLLDDTNLRQSVETAERLVRLFGQRAKLLEEAPIKPALSIGVSSLQQHRPADIADMLKQCDQAMYGAKRASVGVLSYHAVSRVPSRRPPA